MSLQQPQGGESPLFRLEYPQSVGVFNTYSEAQKAVDSLADQDFPVKNLAIVGTDLKLVERVTGRRTWGTVLGQGVMSGLSTGFIVAIFMMLLLEGNILGQLLTALLIGVGVGLMFAILGYALSRGQRDFTSVTQTVATKYEILCEHKHVGKARELLSDTLRKASFSPHGPPQPAGPAGPGGPSVGYPAPQYGQSPPGAPPGHGYPPPPAAPPPPPAGQGGPNRE